MLEPNVAASTVGAAFKTTNCHTAAPLTSLLASAATTTKSSDASSSLQKSAVPVGAVNLEELEAMLCGKTKPPQMQNAESDATKSEGTPAMKQLLLKNHVNSAVLRASHRVPELPGYLVLQNEEKTPEFE
uniref:Uncharacterized protein n=1 Tax=Romanomermis culicivorax TaxID=13658 RepID=A0A915IVL5_ROMCU